MSSLLTQTFAVSPLCCFPLWVILPFSELFCRKIFLAWQPSPPLVSLACVLFQHIKVNATSRTCLALIYIRVLSFNKTPFLPFPTLILPPSLLNSCTFFKTQIYQSLEECNFIAKFLISVLTPFWVKLVHFAFLYQVHLVIICLFSPVDSLYFYPRIYQSSS